jgi:hypothetical protein
MDGGDRAGYKQISWAADAILVGPTTGSTDYTSGDWTRLLVLSSDAQFAGIVAPGLVGSSRITSADTFDHMTVIPASRITSFKLASGTSGQMVIAYNRILI